MKPVQHEHTVEVNVPQSVYEKFDAVKEHLEENKKPYLFGLGGVAVGFALARVFSRPNINIEITLPKE